MRHRRTAERRQVDALQCADQRGHRGGEFSLLHDRSEHRRRAGAGSAPAGARRHRQAAEDHSDLDRIRRHRRPRRRRVERRRAGQQVPRAHPRGRCDRARRALLRASGHRARRRQDRSDLGHRDHRHRARARRSRIGRQGAEPRRARGQGERQGSARAASGAAESPRRAQRRPVRRARRNSTTTRKALRARSVSADAEAADVHRQRQGRRFREQSVSGQSARARGERRRGSRARMRGDRRRAGAARRRRSRRVPRRHGPRRAGPQPRDPRRLQAARPADLLHRGRKGSACVDGQARLDRAAGRGRDPHRFRARLHPCRDRRLRRFHQVRRRIRRARRGPARDSKARTTSSRKATCCTSASTSRDTAKS